MSVIHPRSLKTRFLLITLVFFLVFVGIAGVWLYYEVRGMIRDLGERYAVERVESARLQLARVLEREAALARNLARAPVLIDWIRDEQDPQKRKRAYDELANYRRSFSDSNSFVGILSSRRYYNWGENGELVTSRMNRDVTADQWFFQTIESGEQVSFNLDYNVNVDVSRVWINCLVEHNGRRLGLAGTGLEITDTVSRLVSGKGRGSSVMLIDDQGVILAHRNSEIMAKNAKVERSEQKTTIFDLMGKNGAHQKIRALMEKTGAETTAVDRVAVEGETGLTAMTRSASLDAYVVASVNTSEYLSFRDFMPMFILLAGAIVIGLAVTTVFMQRIVLRPLAKLTYSAKKIAAGDYDLSIPAEGNDEIAVLSSAFNNMAAKVRDYTQNLEENVRERTAQLRETNEQLAAANNRMTESIRYASLIQSGIMPGGSSLEVRLTNYDLFFRQRDIVGGDLLYVRDVDPDDPQAGFFIAVVDCEGHGVSGALMTMMSDSVLDHVIPAHDPRDPAAILEAVERETAGTFSPDSEQESLQSGFDIGLCVCFPREGKAVYAGAGMPLYLREPEGAVTTIRGRRKAIRNRYRRTPEQFENHAISAEQRTFLLVTDGFVDQSGGEEGRSYGTRRLHEFMSVFDISAGSLEKEFDRYRGNTAQRDDVLALAFSLENTLQGEGGNN